MIFELLAFKNSIKKETFAEEKSSRFYDNTMLLFIIIYMLAVLVLWIRVVICAFKCGTMDGLSSVIFPSLYSLYKFGDLIKLSCNQLY